MSPWSESRPRTWPIYLGIAVIVLGLVTGYLLLTGVIGTDDDGQDPSSDGYLPPGPSTASPSTPGGSGAGGDRRPALEVVDWGQASGQLAVVVRNESRRRIEHARIRITARDSGGVAVVTTSGTAPDVCCTVVGLPPGQDFGLFAELASPHLEIVTVDIEPVTIRTRRAGAEARVAVAKPRLHRYDDDTVATATLTARGSRLSGYVAAQAILTDAQGDVAQVISGRFYCFDPGRPRRIRLRLFHAVPDDLRLDRVVAYPIPLGVRPHVRGRCG